MDQPKTPLLLRAARMEKVESTPIWIMRQAGRYLPEYRQLRQKLDFMQLCKQPEAAVEASLMPIRRFPLLDAAIIFSDILIPVEAMGCTVDFTETGPQIREPIQSAEQIAKLAVPEPKERMPFVAASIAMLCRELGGKLPVFGFAGAPFTLASYMVEGKPSHGFNKIREMLYREPQLYSALAEKLAATVGKHLAAQLDAGAGAVQLFDTWGGLLSEAEYRRFALPYVQSILKPLSALGATTILYINGGQHLTAVMAESGASVLSLDWRTDIAATRQRFGNKLVLQGNLNPVTLFASDRQELIQQTRAVLSAFPERRGHIFNLGHGIHPQTPIDNVQLMIDTVKGA